MNETKVRELAAIMRRENTFGSLTVARLAVLIADALDAIVESSSTPRERPLQGLPRNQARLTAVQRYIRRAPWRAPEVLEQELLEMCEAEWQAGYREGRDEG